MEYSKELSDNLNSAFMAISSLRIALYDSCQSAMEIGDTVAVDRLLKATDQLRAIDKTINFYLKENCDALLKELT